MEDLAIHGNKKRRWHWIKQKILDGLEGYRFRPMLSGGIQVNKKNPEITAYAEL
jgi:hypothetical protein